jgi:glycosyltransferase involved in cell wall biosynthesis
MPPDRARDALGLSPEGPVVAWVGRMSHEKAPQVMVEAAARVRTDVTFSMIGDGPERAESEEAARRLGVADRFRWHGPVSEAGALLKAFDVVVLTSWTEGTPMLLLEAMSAGVPIVTTAVGGIPDVVSPEEALLCEAGDVNAIAAAIDSVFDAPDAAKTRAEAARTRVEADFAVEPWALRHVDLYHELVRH